MNMIDPARTAGAFVIATLVGLLVGCGQERQAAEPAAATPARIDSLVTAEWLAAHIDDADLVVLDCSVVIESDGNGNMRSVSGRDAYEAGHIPGAGFADLKHALSDADSPLDYAVPAPEQFAAAMSALGVGDDTRVVLYDSSGGVWSARVWWMLRWIGFDNAALLDGGLDAWTAPGRPLSTDPSTEPERTLSIDLRPELIADRDEVFAAIDDDAVELIDALPEASYTGEMVMYDRPGHITSATNVSVMTLLNESGTFKSDVELQSLFDGRQGKRNIHYCGGGIAASATAFAMTRAGYDDVAVYTASLQEWAADPANPMETGAAAEGDAE
jgi:thiosulfate/3-mercaptopyruvate sulfurtransferase